MPRKAVYSDAFAHTNPIPAACQVGHILVTGIVSGVGLHEGDKPGTLDEQCALMFERVAEIMKSAGGSTDNIVKLNVQMVNPDDRKTVNVYWTKMFPDAASRPVRQTLQANLDRGKLIQCDIMAVMDKPA